MATQTTAVELFNFPAISGKARADPVEKSVCFTGLPGSSVNPAGYNVPDFNVDVGFATELYGLVVNLNMLITEDIPFLSGRLFSHRKIH